MRILPLLLTASMFTACSTTTQTNTTTNSSSAAKSSASSKASAVTSDMITYDKEDSYSDWKSESPNYIELSGTSALVKGSGAAVSGSKITISSPGVYALSGKLDNGQIIVDVKDKGTVKLVLNGAEINCSDNAPIYVKNADKAIISLQEGTNNSITDGKKYTLADASTDEPSAAIFSKANLTINGTGKLTVTANYKDGIVSKDDLKLTGGSVNVTSADDGLIGKDMVLVKDGNISITAVGDGIKSTNDTDTKKGFIAIEGGTFEVKSGADGIQAETSALITAGKFNIVTGGGSANAPVKQNDMGPGGRGNQNNTATTKTEEKQSAKALKVSADLTISGGNFNIDSKDDALHSSNSVNIAGGDFTIAAGDDGVHADTALNIKNGKVNIKKSYEGIESTKITVSGGETHIISSDDGVNASDSSSTAASNGNQGQNNTSSNSSVNLTISGGYISVDSQGDGLDANGSMTITGGTAVVSGPTENNNAAIDYDSTLEITGGTLIAAGSSGMAQAPSDDAKQYSAAMYFTSTQKAGTLVTLKDSSGKTIASYAPNKDYQSVVISSPELKKGAEYTIYTGGTLTGTATDGLYTDGQNEGGKKVVSFTISNSVTWLDENGVTTKKSGGPGGQGGHGGFGGQGGQRPNRN